jgi:NADH dehydrogenase
MILVAGGTGRLGSLVANRLHAEGCQVRVLSRGTRPPSSPLDPAVQTVRADVRDPDSLRAAMDGVDVVVSAIQGFAGPGNVTPASVDRDGNTHLIEAAEEVGADVVLLSVCGAAADSPMELFRMKHAAEQRLRAGRCRWTIVRPEAYVETWLDVMTQTAGRGHRPLVFGRGETPIWFVSVDDVAELVVRAVLDESLRGRVLEISGPEPATMSELAHQLMTRMRWAGDPRHVPRPMLHVMAKTVGMVRPGVRRQARAALAMETLRRGEAIPVDVPGLPRTRESEVVARLPAPVAC